MILKRWSLCLIVLLLAALAGGCETNDQRLVDVTREASQRQADQNREIAHQNRQIAETTKQLVEADAKSRQELVSLERDLQTERVTIGRQRDQLEAERQKIAGDRRWDSATGGALDNAAMVVAALLPLILCWHLLHRSHRHDAEVEVEIGEILTAEIVSDHPLLLPREETRPGLPSDAADHRRDLPGQEDRPA